MAGWVGCGFPHRCSLRSLLKNRGWQRGEEFFHKARRNKGEGRDLRLRRNEAFGKKVRRPKGILPPCHGAASLPILPILWIRCRVRFFNRLLADAGRLASRSAESPTAENLRESSRKECGRPWYRECDP
jgi:hypothetical protein